jgi:hypothetical protein
MAGPEPYPQYKATDEELKRHAESRKASSARARPSTSGKRKRYVRTAAGAKRYRVPVGSEIGSARNASGAQAQKDTESTDRYGALVGADRNAQAAAMRGLSDDQLQRLSRVAYSFRSSNPDVVRLRIGVAGELRRRGFNVNNFGALGGRGSSSRGTSRSTRSSDRAKDRARSKRSNQTHVQKAMAAMYGPNRKVNLATPEQLRAAISVFGRVASDKREKVARLLVRRSIELGAPHFLGQSVIEAANLSDSERGEVVELAGRWRHGYIPLDAAALSEKMKGKTGGKKWWDGGGSGKAPGVPKKGGAASKANPGQKLQGWKRAGELDRMDTTTRKKVGDLNKSRQFDEASRVARQSRETNRSNLRRRESSKMVRPDQAPQFKAQQRGKPDFAAKRKAGVDTAKKTPVTETLRSKTDRVSAKAAGPTGPEAAKNYVEMHSVAGARKKIEQIKKRNGGKETPMTRALEAAIEVERERIFQNNRARSRGTGPKA